MLRQIEMLSQKYMSPVVPHDLTHGNWANNLELFNTRVVWLRLPVSVLRRFEVNEEVGETHGVSFMCFRVIPDAWIKP